MVRKIKIICKACQTCEKGKVRRQNLSAEFEQTDKDDIPLPRQAYGIDFYGQAKGEILVVNTRSQFMVFNRPVNGRRY